MVLPPFEVKRVVAGAVLLVFISCLILLALGLALSNVISKLVATNDAKTAADDAAAVANQDVERNPNLGQ